MNLPTRLGIVAITLAMFCPLVDTTAGEKKKAGPPVELTDKATDTWLLKKLQKGAKVLSDRDYLFTAFPDEVAGGYYILRDAGDWKQWVPPGAVKADKDVTVYLFLNTHRLKKENVTEIHFNLLAKDGWKVVQGDVEGTFNAREGWAWKAVKKDYKKGDLIIHLRRVSLNVPVIFVFK